MEALMPVLQFLLPVLATVLTVVLSALAKRWLEKAGVERSEKIDDMIDNYVEKGVLSAERAAGHYLSANAEKMEGESKKAHALAVVLGELEQSGLRGVAQDLITARIEAYLETVEPGKLTGEPESIEV